MGRYEDEHRNYIAFFEQCGATCDAMREAMERGWAEGGREASVRAWLGVVTSIEGFSRWMIAGAYTMIGETDEAFAWLERGYNERDPQMIYLKADPSLDPLRSDPRYHDPVRRIGIPEE
jgi:hypothetical protein